jgi:tRNA pseudouridine38-40 synthase
MTRFRLTVEYDGRGFMGWQRQAHGPSVQAAIEDAVLAITGEERLVHAAGRTDSGVHATAMTAHVDIDRPLSPFRLGEALNARLRLAGASVAIINASVAADDFHARFSCTGRAYEYRLICRRAPLTFEQGLVWRRPAAFDIGAMREAAAALVGRHDFTTFRAVQCQAQSPVKTLDRLEVEADGERVVVCAAARSFLHHQVRSMVGALVWAGEGRCTPQQVKAALEARDRAALAINAPPDGLWFVGAEYAGSVGQPYNLRDRSHPSA